MALRVETVHRLTHPFRRREERSTSVRAGGDDVIASCAEARRARRRPRPTLAGYRARVAFARATDVGDAADDRLTMAIQG